MIPLLPSHFTEAWAALPISEVSYGVGGIKLFSLSELEDAQVGYSRLPDGSSLCTGEAGRWNPNWVVIAYETGCGDPLFIDAAEPELPVMTAFHGEGAWDPQPVARSIEAFLRSLELFANIAATRSDVADRDNNPVSAEERARYLGGIAQINGIDEASDFWGALLEY